MSGPPDSPANPHVSRDQTPDVSGEELLELLGDEYTRCVLRAVTDRPRTGPEIADAADVSKATVYRRLERLEEADLVVSTQKLDPDGHHCKEFHAVVTGIDFEFGQGGLSVSVRTDEQPSSWSGTRLVAND
ncbi:MAG: winged helix-turn-helix domain-containing protein [Haloarculaceae archaeon]|jgi:predicted ArsR family transcriptional regulator